jgi:hypothetical protein
LLFLSDRETTGVTTLRLHYDGWLALPPATLQKLGITTGDVLEVALADDSTILLRSVAKRAPEQVRLDGAAADEALSPAKRKRSRLRKVATAEPLATASATNEAQGEPPALSPQLEREPAPVTAVRVRSELRRKLVLPPSFLDHVPARGRRTEQLLAGSGYEREERRPFSNVEVRKLGPGRGHNKTGRLAS